MARAGWQPYLPNSSSKLLREVSKDDLPMSRKLSSIDPRGLPSTTSWSSISRNDGRRVIPGFAVRPGPEAMFMFARGTAPAGGRLGPSAALRPMPFHAGGRTARHGGRWSSRRRRRTEGRKHVGSRWRDGVSEIGHVTGAYPRLRDGGRFVLALL